jgi:cytochrome oxidase Cu insertion factor (SCO1/SenC/PrrC family)
LFVVSLILAFAASGAAFVVLAARLRDKVARQGNESSFEPQVRFVPDFRLTERSGRPVTRAQLEGRTWIAGFVFTRCAGPCPLVTATMAQLQHELPDEIALISFSVDPEFDTPGVLTQYAARYKADPSRWWFLTGDRDELYRLIEEGFGLGVQQDPDPKKLPGERITHTTRLAVVDPTGRIRGYYDATDPYAIDLLKRKVKAVMESQP